MPPEDHVFLEAVEVEQVRPGRQLKIAGAVVGGEDAGINDLVEPRRNAGPCYGFDGTSRIHPVEPLPQRLRRLEARGMVYAGRQLTEDVGQARYLSGYQNVVGIRRQDPTIVRIGSPQGDVAGDR